MWSTNPRAPAAEPVPVYASASYANSSYAGGHCNGGATVASLAAGASGPTAAPAAGGGGGFYVQTGSFSTPENAERQRGLVRSYGSSEISTASAGGREVYRVRIGPYTTPDAAGIVADRLKRSGYGDARVVSD